MQRALQVQRQRLRHQGQRQRVEALHVDGAPAVGTPVRDPQDEGVAGPGLAGHGHHVGMARQHDAAVDLRPERGEERRLVARRIRHADVRHAVPVEIGGDPVDQREVRFRTLGVEGDETLQDVEGLEALGHAA